MGEQPEWVVSLFLVDVLLKVGGDFMQSSFQLFED